MLRYLLSILFLYTCLHSGDITTPPTQITTTDFSLREGGVTCCFIESKNQVFYTWADTGTEGVSSKPFFALFDALKDTWIIEKQAIDISYENGVNIGTSCCYHSAANQVIICWADADDYPRYVIYDVSAQAFQNIQKIEGESAYALVTCCYNQTKNQVIFCWKSGNDDTPVYSVLSSNGSMSEPQSLSGYYPKSSVYCCSTKSSKVVFSYSNSDGDSVIIDVLDLDTSKIVEKELDPTPNLIYNDVFCSYNSSKNQIMLSWATTPDGPYWKPYYAIFDPISYLLITDTPQPISVGSYEAPSGKNPPPYNVYSCYSKIDNKKYFSWGENTPNGRVYYAIYDPKISDFSTPATAIGQDYAIGIYSYGVYTCTGLNKVFFSWASLEGTKFKQPWYAVYSFYTSLPKAIQKFSPIKFQRI